MTTTTTMVMKVMPIFRWKRWLFLMLLLIIEKKTSIRTIQKWVSEKLVSPIRGHVVELGTFHNSKKSSIYVIKFAWVCCITEKWKIMFVLSNNRWQHVS